MNVDLDNEVEINSCRDIVIALIQSLSGDNANEYKLDPEAREEQLQLCSELLKCLEQTTSRNLDIHSDSSLDATCVPNIREILGNLPASYISRLPLVLAELLTNRIEAGYLLPDSQDESATTEAIFSSTSAVTVTSLAMISGTVYATMVGIPGGLGYGLIHVGALSGLSALVRRWTVECRGREPGARNTGTSFKRRVPTASRNKKPAKKKKDNITNKKRKRQLGIRRSARLASAEISDEEDISLNDLTMKSIHEEDNQKESCDTANISAMSEKEAESEETLVSDGLRLVMALSRALFIPDFRSWSIEAQEALIDALSAALGCAPALSVLACDGSALGQSISDKCSLVADSISRGFVSFIGKNSPSIQTKPSPVFTNEIALLSDDDFDERKANNIVFVLRGLFPLLSFQVELPNGYKGKQAAFDVAVSTFQGIAAAASADVLSNFHKLSTGLSSSSKSEVVCSTKKRGLHSARRLSATPSRRRSLSDTPNHRSMIEKKSLIPSLNKAMTPKSIRFERINISSTSDGMLVRPRRMLGSIVGLLQRVATLNDLNKADFRLRATSLIQSSLAVFPEYERSYFLRFIYNLTYSKRASHRVLAVELIGRVLSEEWLWLYHCDNEPISFTYPMKFSNKTDMDECPIMQSSVWIGGAGSLDARCPPIALLAALQGRMSDTVPVVRARAIHSLSALIASTRITEGASTSMVPPLSYQARRCSISTLEALADSLKKSLLKRATLDERATVRTASIVGLKNLLLVECDRLSNDSIFSLSGKDIAVLTKLCSDESVSVRKTAAESITSLLLECSSRGACDVITELLEESWASRVLVQAADEETTCAAAAVHMFMQVVIDPIIRSDENAMSMEHNRRYISAWRILARSTGQNSGSGTASSGALRIALLKVFQTDNNSSKSPVCISLLKEMRVVSLKTLNLCSDLDLDSNATAESHLLLFEKATDSVRRGVWSTFDAVRDCLRMTSEIKQKSGQISFSFVEAVKAALKNGDLFVRCWNELKALIMDPSIPNHCHFSTVSCCRSCLRMISDFGSLISIDMCCDAKNELQELLFSQQLPADIISFAIHAVLSLIKNISIEAGLSEDSGRSACYQWLSDLLSSSSSVLDNFFRAEPRWMAEEGELVVRLERALISIGEVVLVGFSIDEDGAPSTSEILGVKVHCLDDPIRGLYLKPSQSLVERIQALIAHSLPSMNESNGIITTPPNIRAVSVLTLGKFCLRDEFLAKSCLNLLLQELQNNEDECGQNNATVQSNALLVLGDLCVRYTNIVDSNIAAMASCLQAGAQFSSEDQLDEFEIVRTHAVLTLSTLLLQDFIKWRGLLFHRFLAATVDASEKVAPIAKAILCGPLLSKQPNLFHNNFVEAIFVLNDCVAHPIYNAAVNLGENVAGTSVEFDGIKLLGSQNRSRRHQIYSMMLRHLTDEDKIGVTARLTKDVFGSALRSGDLNVACKLSAETLIGDGESISAFDRHRIECAINVLKDTFSVLMSPLCQVGRDRSTDQLEDEEDSNFSDRNTFSAMHLAAVKGRLLTNISRKHLCEVVVPILCNLKSLLEDSRSGLLQDLMLYLVYIYRRYKEEVKELLASNPILLREIDYDTRQFERRRRESQHIWKASVSQAVTPHPIFHL